MLNISYWAFFGTLYLIILTYQDYKNNMLVDDRLNSVMIGITISLYSHIFRGFWYCILLSLFCIVWYFIMKLYIKQIGEADFKALSWIMLGFGIIAPFYVIIFWIIFILGYLFYFSIKTALIKYNTNKGKVVNKETPFFGLILVTFVTTCIIFGLFI